MWGRRTPSDKAAAVIRSDLMSTEEGNAFRSPFVSVFPQIKLLLSLRRIRSLQMAVFLRAERKEKGNEGEMISFRARCSKYSTFCLTLCAPCRVFLGRKKLFYLGWRPP